MYNFYILLLTYQIKDSQQLLYIHPMFGMDPSNSKQPLYMKGYLKLTPTFTQFLHG